MIYSIFSALLLFFSEGEISSVGDIWQDTKNLAIVINPFFSTDYTWHDEDLDTTNIQED